MAGLWGEKRRARELHVIALTCPKLIRTAVPRGRIAGAFFRLVGVPGGVIAKVNRSRMWIEASVDLGAERSCLRCVVVEAACVRDWLVEGNSVRSIVG